MRFLGILSCLFCSISVSGQLPKANELYKKIESFYLQNPGRVEYVEHTHKNALGFDTLRSSFAYLPNDGKSFMIAWISPEYSVINGLLVSDNNYHLATDRPEKIKVKDKELEGTIYSKLDYIPSYHSNNLEKTFGKVKSFNKAKGQYQVLTSKYILKVDTLSFRINSLARYVLFEGRVQYDFYEFILLPDSIQAFLKQQVHDLAEASKDFSVTNFKEIRKNRIPAVSSEGQSFVFKTLESFNKGPLDSAIKNKYVILDFFYQTCYPCHQMTKWILEWIPTMDTSRIILIGVDPTDTESSMQLFVKARGIDYPIIIGKQAKDIARYYHISAYPTLFLLSPDGNIQVIHEGMSKSFLTRAGKIVSR